MILLAACGIMNDLHADAAMARACETNTTLQQWAIPDDCAIAGWPDLVDNAHT